MSKKTYVPFDMDRGKRLDEFVRRMMAAAGCASQAEAMALLSATLIAVEDEFSGIPFDPDFPRDDGRMYPPKADAYRAVPGHADLHRFRSVRHNSYFSDEGAILILDLEKRILMDKPDSKARSIIL